MRKLLFLNFTLFHFLMLSALVFEYGHRSIEGIVYK